MPGWTKDDMDRAISGIKYGGLDHWESAEKHQVPGQPLELRLNNPELGKQGKDTLLDWDTELV